MSSKLKMLSLEERLKIKKEEEMEIEQIKEKTLKEVRKEKTLIDIYNFYKFKVDVECGLYFGTPFERVSYVSLATVVLFFSTYNLITYLSKFM